MKKLEILNPSDLGREKFGKKQKQKQKVKPKLSPSMETSVSMEFSSMSFFLIVKEKVWKFLKEGDDVVLWFDGIIDDVGYSF